MINLTATIFLAVVVVLSGPLVAQESLPPKLDESVSRGLDYLVKQQNPDGSFSIGTTPDASPTTQPAAPSAVTTGLALLAFLSGGHTPDVGRHGLVVRNAIDFLVAKVPENGLLAEPAGMYGHGVVALALAEAYGVENDRGRRTLVRAAAAKMLAAILAAQNVAKSEVHAGGWGETPTAADSNLWATGWNVLAIVACRDAGFSVPPDAADRARHYVLKCRNPLDRGFAFQPGGRGEPATTAIGVVCLNLLDDADPPELRDARKFLAQAPPLVPAAAAPAAPAATQPVTQPATQASTQPATQPAGAASRYPLYSAYCAVQAHLHAGEPAWSTRARPVLDALITTQAPDGGWSPRGAAGEEPGRSHATALAVLTLTVPYHLLPLYQE